ncbi:MAG: 3-deoxy-manno-octulosonate cytidylyltransferase [Bacteroidota bacterium]
MNAIGIIPARYASSRFPGKPLVEIKGLPMIQRVYQQAIQSKRLSKLIVATDDLRIYDAVKQFGGEVMMTKDSHPSGTDRIAEVAEKLPDYEWVINIQGDEPLIDPQQIDLLLAFLAQSPNYPIATLAHPIQEKLNIVDPNTVKVVFDKHHRALYFSRSPIPAISRQEEAKHTSVSYYQHIGMYAFQRKRLLELAQLKPSILETAESLEQLRWLENGYAIGVCITDQKTIAVDCPEDLEKIKALL